MNDIIPIGNTPIFEQLVREMAARGKRFESLLSGNINGLRPVIKETFDPSKLMDQAIDPNLHVQEIIKKFSTKYPDIAPVHITRLDNKDGTITITVQKGEMLEQSDEAVKPLSEVTPANITTGFQVLQEKLYGYLQDEMTIDPETIDPKYRSIGEDTADVLYMKSSTWGSDEE